ncbi:GIY-YIG nuclease family protein [Patescibacteria group bacterium]|nr:GIY-YIG nuclease family protein [Patescibacteria group bacterium]
MDKQYFIYILTNKNNTVLYTGITSNLQKRIWEHKNKIVEGFSKKYNLTKLIYYETFDNPTNAIDREKQLKAGNRKKKIELIEKNNKEWEDLYNSIL